MLSGHLVKLHFIVFECKLQEMTLWLGRSQIIWGIFVCSGMYSYTVALISGMDMNVLEDPAESCCLLCWCTFRFSLMLFCSNIEI